VAAEDITAAERREKFLKVEGLGNDFILVDLRGEDPTQLERRVEWFRARASAICDRRTGIGADGVLLVGPGRAEAAASMTVVNFDGSRPEMCGNGLRCVAAIVAERSGSPLVIATDAGPKRAEVGGVGLGGVQEVRIDMGPGRMLGPRAPAAGEGRDFLGVSMGNPHAVCFVASDERPELLARRLGPGVELDAAYAPEKTNVEFARVRRDSSGQLEIELWVWERGVGITQACGTGACATVVAAVHAGLVPVATAVGVRLPGGLLTITAPSDPREGVIMTGPCRKVFWGAFDPAMF
jgi:diaminopimelate epimerase